MIGRNIERRLLAALADTPVVLLHGARQSGKTTLVKWLAGAPSRRYLTLDDATVLSAAQADPDGFVRGLDGPVTIDEAQRAPELFRAIKAEVDRDRTPGRFLLTGSANVLLMPRISESLAGRVEIVTLRPLSQGEIEGTQDKFIDAVFAARLPAVDAGRSEDLLDRVVRGGYPEPLSRTVPERRAAWFSSYVTTILQRDVRDVSGIQGLSEFPRLLALLASRASGLLNYSDLSRGLSLPQTTLKRYFALLETTFLVALIPAWSSNQGLRLTKAAKIMIGDTGLAAHLAGADLERLRSDGHLRGTLLENFVAVELLKQASWSKLQTRLHHYRTPSGREVDLVLEDAAGRLVGIEVKSSSAVSSDDFGGLRSLRDAVGDRFVRGVVLHDGSEVVTFEKGLVAMPFAALWRA